MDPLITLELTFAKTDIETALHGLRQARYLGLVGTTVDHEMVVLGRALGHLDRADAMSASPALSHPLVREEVL